VLEFVDGSVVSLLFVLIERKFHLEFPRQLFMTNNAALEFVERRFIIVPGRWQFRIKLFLQQQRFRRFTVDRGYFVIDGRSGAVQFLRTAHAGFERKLCSLGRQRRQARVPLDL